jgi:replicative DNA helicase
MMIFRPGVYEKDNLELQNAAEIIVAKQRNGPVGTVNLVFLSQYTMFANIADQGMA